MAVEQVAAARASKPVFISYARSSSRDSARALHAALGEAADVAFLDTEDLSAGDRFPAKVAHAIFGARIFVVFADDVYFTRWLCLRELRMAFGAFDAISQQPGSSTEDLEAALDHIIIALPDTGAVQVLDNVPPNLRTIGWPKASDTARLVSLIRTCLDRSRPTIGERLEAAGGNCIYDSLLAETALPPSRPLIEPHFPPTLPPSLNERFVGRADDLFRIHFNLSTLRGEPTRTAALTGAIEAGGGFRKTRLALEYIWRFGSTYYPGGLFWLVADQGESGLERQCYGMFKCHLYLWAHILVRETIDIVSFAHAVGRFSPDPHWPALPDPRG